MAISKRLRYEILTRDNNTCRYCHATDTPLTIDHVVPTALGGTDDPSNLVAACKDCNAGKSSSNPHAITVAQVGDDAVRWAAAIVEAARRTARGDDAMQARIDRIAEYWDECVPSYKRDRPKYRLPMDWRSAVIALLDAGLPDAMVLDSIDVAMSRTNLDNVFRYMLGVANNKLAKLQEDARAILAEESESPAPPNEDVETIWWKKGFDDAFSLPLVPEFYIQARALSRVVDGENAWNRRMNA
jgi:hypothetical protein